MEPFPSKFHLLDKEVLLDAALGAALMVGRLASKHLLWEPTVNVGPDDYEPRA